MKYLLVWAFWLLLGAFVFPEHFWLYFIVLLALYFVNKRYSGEFSKNTVGTFVPVMISQMVSSILGPQLGVCLAALLEKFGISMPAGIADNIHVFAAIIPFLIVEPIFLYTTTQLPIKKNRSAKMKNILRTEEFKTFSAQLSDMIRELDRDSQWDPSDFVQLEAEVDIVYNDKVLPRTKNLLRALRQSPRKNSVSLVIGEPGSGKSVAMRKLCVDLLKKSRFTKRIPLYVDLKNWNKNWAEDRCPTWQDLERFILDSFNRRGGAVMARFFAGDFNEILTNGGWFFILDSYDEIPFLADNAQNAAYNAQASEAIYKFLTLNRCGGVLASRPFRSPDTASFRAGNRFHILPFNERQIIKLFKKKSKLSVLEYRTLFQEHLDVVDLARTPLLASLVGQYYFEKKSWPSSQKQLYGELMDSRIRDALGKSSMPELAGAGPEQIMEIAASMAYLMMEDERYHSSITLAEAHGLLPYRSALIDAAAKLLDSARICKLSGEGKGIAAFVHRRFMEFFVTQSRQFTRKTALKNISDIWTLGNYHDVLVLYGEVCEANCAKELAAACCERIMEPGNNFRNIRDSACLYAVNSLDFLFQAFRNRTELISDHMDGISKKVLKALKDGCSDIACLSVFASSAPLFSGRYREAIMVLLMDFKYQWIGQYLARIFYQQDAGPDVLLAHAENLKAYGDGAFMKELPKFLFAFGKSKGLETYCWLRAADILLNAAVFSASAAYIAWLLLFSGQLAVSTDLTTWTALLKGLEPVEVFFLAVSGACCLAYMAWLGKECRSLHTACYISLLVSIPLATGLEGPALAALYVLIVFLLVWNVGLGDLAILKLKYQAAGRKLKRASKFLAGAVCMLLCGAAPLGCVWLACRLFGGDCFGTAFGLACFFVALTFFRPVRFVLDEAKLRLGLRQIESPSAALTRCCLEDMLCGMRGKRHKAKLVNRLYHRDAQLTGSWRSCRPAIGVEEADWMLAALDTRDINVRY